MDTGGIDARKGAGGGGGEHNTGTVWCVEIYGVLTSGKQFWFDSSKHC